MMWQRPLSKTAGYQEHKSLAALCVFTHARIFSCFGCGDSRRQLVILGTKDREWGHDLNVIVQSLCMYDLCEFKGFD